MTTDYKTSNGMSSPPLYNSSIIDTYIRLIKNRYSYVNVAELLRYAGMEMYQVGDQGHWFTQEQVDRFYEKLESLTGNRQIAREAGRYAASPESLGVLRQYLLGLVGPAEAFELVNKAAANFTRSAIYESKRIGSNEVEITVTPREGVQEKLFQCENRIGFFEAINMMFHYSRPRIEHPECLFSGGEVCRYVLSWRESHSAFWKKLRNYTAIFLLFFSIVLALTSTRTLTTALPVSFLIVLLLSFVAIITEKKDIAAALDHLRTSTDKLMDQINANYNNALLILEVGQALSKQMETGRILEEVIKVLEKRLDYGRGLILMANPEKTRLVLRAGFGYSEKEIEWLKKTSLHLDRPTSKGVMVRAFKEQRPFLVNDINTIADELSPRSLAIALKLGMKSFICCPIIYENESLGILTVDNVKTKRPLTQSDINILMGIAPEIGTSIHNMMMIESRERQFKSIIQVLAASIDARDPVTAGHSERVTEYAIGICREMQLPDDYCEMIRTAALLHDYGKIAVDDSILKKTSGLTQEEYEEIKNHAGKTREILEQVSFEGIYGEIPGIAGSHHEKVDGSGYPRGLKGVDIPLGAKIIAVADFYEALTSYRRYREPMPEEMVFDLLRQKTGTDFQDDVVAALISYCRKRSAKEEPVAA